MPEIRIRNIMLDTIFAWVGKKRFLEMHMRITKNRREVTDLSVYNNQCTPYIKGLEDV